MLCHCVFDSVQRTWQRHFDVLTLSCKRVNPPCRRGAEAHVRCKIESSWSWNLGLLDSKPVFSSYVLLPDSFSCIASQTKHFPNYTLIVQTFTSFFIVKRLASCFEGFSLIVVVCESHIFMTLKTVAFLSWPPLCQSLGFYVAVFVFFFFFCHEEWP